MAVKSDSSLVTVSVNLRTPVVVSSTTVVRCHKSGVVQCLGVRHHIVVRARNQGTYVQVDVVQQLQLLLRVLSLLQRLLLLLLLLRLHCCPGTQRWWLMFGPLQSVLPRAFPPQPWWLLHVGRRPGAVRRCGPLFARIHQALFDTSFSSCIEFVSSSFPSTHSSCVVISTSPSCPSLGLHFLGSTRFVRAC